MPKILDSEIRYSVISLFCTGSSRDEIAEKLGIGKGTVSKFLAEFQNRIGEKQYNTVRGNRIFLRKENVPLAEAISGANILQQMKEYGITKDDIHLFFDSLSEIKGIHNIQELLSESVKMIHTSKDTGKSFQQVREEYEKLCKIISDLKGHSSTLQADVETLKAKRLESLQKNSITEKILRQFTVTRRSFLDIGLDLAELPQYNDALAEIKRRGFDAKKILIYLQKTGNLQETIEANEKYLIQLNSDIKIAKDQLYKISSKLKTTEQQYRQYACAMRIILKFIEKGHDPSTVIFWNQILQQCNMGMAEFGLQLEKFQSMSILVCKISDEIRQLEEQKAHLESKIKGLDSEYKEISQMIGFAQTELDKKIACYTKEITKMHANPLYLVKESKEPKQVLPVLSIMLKEMPAWLKKHNIEDKDIARYVETLASKIDGIVSGK